MDYAALVLRFLLGAVFVLAGTGKLRHRAAFARAVANYELVRPALARAAARLIPPLELLCGVLLLLGAATRVAAAVVGLALVGFAIAISANLARGRRIECGCSSAVAPRQIGWSLVLRNALLAAAAVLVAVVGSYALALDNLVFNSRRDQPSDGSALAVVIGTLSVLAAGVLTRTAAALHRALVAAPPRGTV